MNLFRLCVVLALSIGVFGCGDGSTPPDEPAPRVGFEILERLPNYTPSDTLIIELFVSNLVVRTDNQDSFQGPAPFLQGRF